METVWPGVAVGDASLARCISVLRRRLGGEAGVEVIQALPKFGYRFALPVSAEPPRKVSRQDAPAGQMGRRRWAAVGGAAVVLAVAVLMAAGRLAKVRAARAESNSAAAYWESYGLKALEDGTDSKASKALQHAERLAPRSASIHLNLAEVSFSRDFIEAAQKQVLIAEMAPESRELSEADKLRLGGLHAMLVQDYETAAGKYRQALAHAEPAERILLLEEAGTAYERQGAMEQAQASYAEAARLDPTSAGPELSLGKLDYLQRNWTAAAEHFGRAEERFQAASNLEGLAEVSYQRALVDYVQAKYGEEETNLKKSLAIADSLSDSDLHLRCVGALSTMYRWAGRTDLGQQYALRETEEAVAAGSAFFYAAGIMLQANVAVALHDRAASERLLQQAADLAQQTGNARQKANAEYSLANFSGDTGDYAREIQYANESLLDYKSYGSVDGVADAQLLRVEGERSSGALATALADAQDLLKSSESTHSDLFTEDTETELGRIYSAMGNEAEALVQFLRAQEWSRRTGSQPWLKTLHVAASYARSGRWSEAKAAWKRVPLSTGKDPDCAGEFAEVKELMKGH